MEYKRFVSRGGQVVDLEGTRNTLIYLINTYSVNDVIKSSVVAKYFGISQGIALNRLKALCKNGYLRTKKLTNRKKKDSRIFFLGYKALREELPREKNLKKEEEDKYVNVEKKIIDKDKFLGEYYGA